MRKIARFLAVVLANVTSFAAAQTAPSATGVIPSKALLADIDVLQQAYEAIHPGLYRYNTREEMAAHFDALRKVFAQDRSLPQAYLELCRFTAKVQCGHTYPNFFNQRKSVAAALFGGKNRVPFEFRWIDGRMIVTRNRSSVDSLTPGTEIRSINGVPVGAILKEMLALVRADGGNDAKRVVALEVRGESPPEAFDVFLPLLHPEFGEELQLSIFPPGGGSSSVVTVPALDASSRNPSAAQPGDATRPLWNHEYKSPDVAYLHMPTWAMYNSKWDWQSYLNGFFDGLIAREVKHLIIDLRGNEGGNDVGNMIIARIAAAPVRVEGYARFTRYRAVPPALAGYLDTWDDSFKDWKDAATPAANGFFRLRRYDDDAQGDVIVPAGKRFAGRVIVLIDSTNSSATGQFAQVVKQHKLATLVGQPTGGNQRGINGGAFFFLRLPNSQIEVDLPIIGYFPQPAELPDGQTLPFLDRPNAGIEPDVLVKPTATDIARGVDVELLAALAGCK